MFQNSLYTANKKSKLISTLSYFTNPFIPPCDDQVSDAGDLFWFHQHAPCYQLLREVFLQSRMVDSDAIYGYNTGRELQS